ncbi:PPR_1 domain-containing protein [Cephalotus follicularis]|uniref:PPR_1 domain-containing protein n=1 Tax=Cephalotus follicularis TaxID=3775 RepID=A0A1Q3DCB3_CEPFO|nr:PPR_1 domain-containing protein [Cephalotus follicularis]
MESLGLKVGLEPTAVTFSTLINGLCIEGKIHQAVRLFDQMVEIYYLLCYKLT